MFKSYINRRSVTVRKTHSGISCDWQTINFWSVNFRIQRCSAPWFCGFAAHLLQCRDGNPLCPIDLGLCSFPPSMPRDKINKTPRGRSPAHPGPRGPSWPWRAPRSRCHPWTPHCPPRRPGSQWFPPGTSNTPSLPQINSHSCCHSGKKEGKAEQVRKRGLNYNIDIFFIYIFHIYIYMKEKKNIKYKKP